MLPVDLPSFRFEERILATANAATMSESFSADRRDDYMALDSEEKMKAGLVKLEGVQSTTQDGSHDQEPSNGKLSEVTALKQ